MYTKGGLRKFKNSSLLKTKGLGKGGGQWVLTLPAFLSFCGNVVIFKGRPYGSPL